MEKYTTEVSNTTDTKSLERWKLWKKRRYVVSILAFFGFFNVYSLRVNLSIAIVAMTEIKNVTLNNGTVISEREFDWDRKLQGYILSSFFYGYITTQLIGGYLAARFGGRRIFGMGIAVTAVLSLITPLVAQTNVYLLIAVRIIEGIFEGVTYPCMHQVWSNWAPPLERSRLATIAFSGSYVGTIVSMPGSAALANTFGWPSIFYCFGIIAIVWCIIWIVATAETPLQDSRISQEELKYITGSLTRTENKNNNYKVPWRSILTSMPVWAIIAAHFSENWGWYTLLTELPKYMNYVLKFNLEEAGFMSALPYLAMAIMIQFSGQFADLCLVKGLLTTTQVRKVFNCSAFLAQTVFMVGAAFWNSPAGTTFCLTMAVGLGAFSWAGFSVNHLDIAPQHAGILMGFTNIFGTLPGIISPILTGYVVKDEHSADDWRVVFFITSGLYLVGALIYGLFASGEQQSWAENDPLQIKANVETEEDGNEKSGCENKHFQANRT